MRSNQVCFLDAYRMVLNRGTKRVTRGMETIDCPNAVVTFNTDDSPCSSFVDRKFNLDYAKQEFLWYLRADPYDDSIAKHAVQWQKLKQADGRYFSNYGQYIFKRPSLLPSLGDGVDKMYFDGKLVAEAKSQFEYVVEQLKADKFTRRASIVLLQPYHLFPENVDTVCTYAINFAIYDDQLRMTVHMRSNDVIFGTTNDVFCFWCLYQMVYALVAEHYRTRYKHEEGFSPALLRRGPYVHQVDSLHVYERHYDMIRKIVANDPTGKFSKQPGYFTEIDVPFVTAVEVREYLSTGQMTGEFGTWLNTAT